MNYLEIQVGASERNLLQFVIMNGHAIAMGLFKKDAKKDTDKEAEKMLKKMGREAEGKVRMFMVSMNKEMKHLLKVRMVSLVYEGKGSFHYSPTFSLGMRSPFVAAVVEAAVQVN